MLTSNDWNENLRPLAMNCISNDKLVEIVKICFEEKDSEDKLSDLQKQLHTQALKKYERLEEMYFIPRMIKAVDDAVEAGKDAAATVELVDFYVRNVFAKKKFKNPKSNEAKNITKMCTAIHDHFELN